MGHFPHAARFGAALRSPPMRFRRTTWAVALGVVAALASTFVVSTDAYAVFGEPQVIKNYASGKCLQPESNSANALVVQRSCTFGASQQWRAMVVNGHYFWLRNQATGLCMDLQANSEEEVGNGTLVQVFFCSGAFTSEQWNRMGGSRPGYFQVLNLVKGLCLDVQNRSSSDNARLQVWTCKAFEDAQKFQFIDA